MQREWGIVGWFDHSTGLQGGLLQIHFMACRVLPNLWSAAVVPIWDRVLNHFLLGVLGCCTFPYLPADSSSHAGHQLLETSPTLWWDRGIYRVLYLGCLSQWPHEALGWLKPFCQWYRMRKVSRIELSIWGLWRAQVLSPYLTLTQIPKATPVQHSIQMTFLPSHWLTT